MSNLNPLVVVVFVAAIAVIALRIYNAIPSVTIPNPDPAAAIMEKLRSPSPSPTPTPTQTPSPTYNYFVLEIDGVWRDNNRDHVDRNYQNYSLNRYLAANYERGIVPTEFDFFQNTPIHVINSWGPMPQNEAIHKAYQANLSVR
jgi:hypothetical protein